MKLFSLQTKPTLVGGVALSPDAARNVEENGVDVAADLAALREGSVTAATLLDLRLDAAGRLRAQGRTDYSGWRDYVKALVDKLAEEARNTNRDKGTAILSIAVVAKYDGMAELADLCNEVASGCLTHISEPAFDTADHMVLMYEGADRIARQFGASDDAAARIRRAVVLAREVRRILGARPGE